MALYAEIGYPIITGAAVLLLIAAQFKVARNFYLRINGGAEEAEKKAAEVEARKKAEEVEAKKKAEEEAHN
ncbi:hypothetical protein A2U01_0110846, partial [Trifolium medium]|nr:hypothetical protein [Trifolium medium]